ncbi:fungal transcriptional regulatory [Fusarium beomiforme]|uniref:Fungal transcriptional regulatory n=1 Tax=Fusarium beomiforme TaxID=44412 RepID=A0A9P5DSE6_9HYPO|nr:fungal transcriptional regulatory [Fusarium beomiforme]
MSAAEPVSPRPGSDSGLSRTACERCRRQKSGRQLRCSRQRPTCSRCSRFSIACTYPELADRRRLAARRASTRAEQNRVTSDAVPVTPESTELNVGRIESPPEAPSTTSISVVNFGPSRIGASIPPFDSTNREDLPPRAIGLALLDIYFERLYNATLLFHRTQLLELTGSFANLNINHHDWAVIPPLKNSQHFLHMLDMEAPGLKQRDASLYWFAIGDIDRARINTVMAYASAAPLRPLKWEVGIVEEKDEMLIKERNQGCFWACWATMCISSFPEAYAKNAWDEACDVPLPSDPTKHLSDRNLPSGCYMNREWKQESLDEEVSPHSSIMAEHMKLMGVWVKIQLLNRGKKGDPDTKIEHLAKMAKDIYESSQFPPYNTGNEDACQDLARLLGLHSLYHLCQIVVLCPLVSLFSCRRGNQGDSRGHAEDITKHAIRHGQLIRDYIISHALLTLIQDSIDILSILQTYWVALEPMTRGLKRALNHKLGSLDRVGSVVPGAESGTIEVPVTGVNSPAREEDVIVTTYIESPDHLSTDRSASCYTNAHFGVTDRVEEYVAQNTNVPVDFHQNNLFEWCQAEGLLDIGDDDLDIGTSVDWNMDLDFFADLPSHMA